MRTEKNRNRQLSLKRLFKGLFFSFLFTLISNSLWSQTYNLRFEKVSNNGTTLTVKVQMSLSSAENLGTSNLVFTYDGAEMNTPVLGTIHNFSGGNYETMTLTSPATNTVSLNIELSTDDAGTALATGSGFTDVAEISFTLPDEIGTADFQWQVATTTKTVVYQDDNSTQLSAGTLTNNDLSLDGTAPSISSVSLAANNGHIDVTFGEGVFNTNGGAGALQTSDFALSITGGTATSPTVTSVTTTGGAGLSGGETTIRVNFSVTGSVSGSETLEVDITDGSSIFDEAGNAAAANQTSNNTASMNDKTGPSISTVSLDGSNGFIDVTFGEGVFNTNGGSGALQTSDFALSITGGTATSPSVTSVTTTGGAGLSGGETTMRVNFSVTGTPNGAETLEVDLGTNAVFDAAGNAAVADQTANNTATLNDEVVLSISSISLDLNNNFLTITFSEGVYNTNGGSGALEASDISLSISGGTATSPTISSISQDFVSPPGTALAGGETVVKLIFSYTGTPDGSETLEVDLGSNAVFDVAGNAAAANQTSNNTATMTDETAPFITSVSVDTDNNYVDVTFDEGVYDTSGGSGALEAGDFDLSLGAGTAVNPVVTSVTTTGGGSLSGGEATIRVNFSYTGLAIAETLEVDITSSSIFDAAGNAAAANQTSNNTGTLSEDNTAPSFTIGSNQTVSQSAGAQTISSHTSGMTDNDGSTQTLTFNVSNDNNGIFDVQPDINESTGNLTFTPKSSTFGKATVTVSLSDDGGTGGNGSDTSADQTFDIFITPDNIKINEVHALAGADAEFIEVYNTGASATSLSGLVMVWFNGNDDLAYKDFDLTGSTSSSGFYVIGETAFATKDQDWGATDLQNGPDAVAIYVGSASDFTGASAPTTDGLVDVIVYGSSDDAALRTALGNPALQVAGSSTNSISRTPDGTGGFVAQAATPQATNDVTAPTVTSVSSTTADGTYKINDNIIVTVTFSEAVTVTGFPTLALETGATDQTININGASFGNGTNTIQFLYSVGSGESTSDLAYKATNSLTAGTSIQDAAGNDAVLTLPTPGATNSLSDNKALVIDGVLPTVTSVTSTVSTGAYNEGDVIPVTVTFSEAVTVTGTPQITLETGTTDQTVDYTSGTTTTTLTFNYTVQAGDTNGGGLDYVATNSLALNSGTINDAAGNAATLTLVTPGATNSISATKSITIDTADPAFSALNPSSSSTVNTANVGYTLSEAIASGTVTFTQTSGTADGSSPHMVTLTGTELNSGTRASAALTNAPTLVDGAVYTISFDGTDGAGNTATTQSSTSITFDTTSPTVTSVSAGTADGRYNAGDVITVSVTFSESVLITGTPQITLETGSTDRTADYTSGSGGTMLEFQYTVQAGDESADLDYVSTSALALNGGTINDVAGNAATLTLASPGATNSLGANKDIVIDNTAPTVTSVSATTADGSYKAGDVIEITVTFSEAVSGDGEIELETGTTDQSVGSPAGGGTTTWTFNYTVQSGDVSADLDYTSTAALTTGSFIQDAAGNDATLTLPAPGATNSLGANKDLVIDTTAPTVTSVTSTTADGSYKGADLITITVTFSEVVTLSDAFLELELGAVDYSAHYTTGSGTNTITLEYSIGSDEETTDLDYTSTTALTSGGITDAAGNLADLTLPTPGATNSLGANKAIVIDNTAPTVTSVSATTADGSYNAGDVIAVTVTFSEAVNVTGTPFIDLETGTSDQSVNYTSGTGTTTLTFNYTVQAGDESADLDYVNTNALATAGTIRDVAGNDANLTLATPGAANSLGANKALVIDTTVPTVTSVSSTTANGNYKAGDVIAVTVTFSEAVTVTGTPLIDLATQNIASVSLSSGSGTTTLTFNYTVLASHESADLDYDGQNALNLNGGTIQDAAGNNANLDLPNPGATNSLSANKDIVVDNTVPAFPVVTTPSAATRVNAATATISGTHTEDGVTVHAYADANNDSEADNATSLGNGVVSGGNWSFSVNLTADAANNFVITAVDASSNETNEVDVPTITEDSQNPTISSTSPLDNATDVGIAGDITITFNEDIQFGTGDIYIFDLTDASNSVTINAATPGSQASISGAVLTLSPTNALDLNSNYSVQIAATAIDDLAGNSYAGITDNTTFNFTTINTSVAFSSTTSSAAESTSSADLQVTLNSASASTVTVDYTVVGTATGGGTDYTLASGTLTFNPGDVTKNITIASIIDDALDENDETVIVTLSNPTNAGLGTNTQHTYTINDNDATPTVSFNTTASNGAESVSSADLQVDLSAVSGRNVTVNYTITGTATGSGTDFTLANGALVISAGDANNNITIGSIVEDALDEVDETVIVSLSSPVNATLGSNTQHIYTINDNDATPTVSFNSTTSQGAESVSSANLQVDLSAVSGQDVMVNYTVTGTATGGGTDYTLADGTLTFTAGSSQETITIASIDGDGLDEDDETVIVTLSSPTNATLGTNTVHTYTIQDDDDMPSTGFVTTSSNGDESAPSVTLSVALTGESGRDITLNYAVTGTATGGGTDYTLADGTFTIEKGLTGKIFTIPDIVDDLLDEDNETIIVTLSNPVNAILVGSNAVHTYTINDNDAEPTVAFALATDGQTEDQPSQDIQVSLSAISGKTVTVNYAVTGTATAGGTDHTTTGGTITFNPGDQDFQQQIVGIVDDLLDEENETIILTLSSPSNATLGGQTTHTYTITDNDAEPTVSLSVDNSSIDEASGTATLTATLSAVSGKNVDVTIGYTGTAVNGTDYNSNASTTITINAGSSSATAPVIITPVNDGDPEAAETIIAEITGVVNGTENGAQSQTITIVDDDTPNLTFTTASSNGAESVNSADLTVDLSLASGLTVTADYAVSGTATEGTDFTLADGTITFNPGDVQKTITIASIIDDAIFEGDESVILTLSNLSNANAGTNQVHTYTINNNDAAAVTIADISGNENDGDITVTATLDNAVEGGFTVDVSTADGIAETGDSDYTAVTSQTLTFTGNAGETQTFVISPTADTKFENNETLTVSQGNLANTGLTVDISDGATVTIDNDDTEPVVTLSIDNNSIAENGGTATLTATLSNLSVNNVDVTIGYSGTATNGTDYNSSASTTITVSAGSMSATAAVIITAADDASAEGDETITADITGVTNGTEDGTQSVTVTIADDDAAVVTSVTSSTTNGSYKAGDQIDIQVTFNRAVNVTGTPQLTLETGTTDQTADYTSGDGTTTLTFSYTVEAGDVSSDLDYGDANSLTLNGGTIIGNGLNAVLDLPAPGATNSLGDNAAIIVDTSSPADPVVTTPATDILLNAATQTVSGTHGEDGITINLYADSDNNGVADNASVLTSATVSGGVWSLSASLSGDAANNFVVQAADAAGNTSADVDVPTITEDSTDPVITSDGGAATAGINVNENNTAVTTVTATDANAVTFTISGGADQALFSIASGVLTFTAAPDFENPGDADTDNAYIVEVTTSDGVNTDDTQTITVTVVDLDDNSPVITSDGGGATAAVNVNENSTAVTTVTATDADGVSTVAYSISGGADQALFSMASGVLTFTAAPDFENPGDADTDNAYVVEVTATDGNTTVDTQTITVTVVDQDDNSPVITSDGGGATAALNVDENSTAVTTVTATDADGVSTVTYSISGGADQALFSMASGVLTFAVAPDFENPGDADTDNAYEVEVTATDGNTTVDTQTITVTVADLDDNSPVITSDGGGATAALNVNENSTAVTTVTATDADGVSTVTYSISGGADQALFSMTSGVLTFTAAPDFENPGDADTDNAYVVEVTATDGTTTVDTQTITVTVVDQNDNTPVITASQALSVDETAANSTSVGVVSATDQDAGTTFSSWAITAGNGAGIFAINAATGELTIADNTNLSARDVIASYTLTLTVSDGTNTSATETVTVNILDSTAPAAPVLVSISDDTGSDGADLITNDQTLNFMGTAEVNSVVEVFIDGSSIGTTNADGSGDFTFDHTGTILAIGNYTITAKASDASVNTSVSSNSLSVVVDNQIPAKPVILSISDDTGVSSTDGVTNDDILTFTGTAEPLSEIGLRFSHSSRTFATGVTDANGDWTIAFNRSLGDRSRDLVAKATDVAGNASLESDVFVFVIDTSEPVASSISRADTNPTAASSVDFTVTFSEDVYGLGTGNFQLVFTGTQSANIASISASSGTTLTVTVNNITGEGSFGLNLHDLTGITDLAGNSLNGTKTGEVYNTNFSPTDITISSSSILENNTIGDVVGTLSTADNDAGDTHSYSLISGTGDTDNASFTIDGSNLKAAEVFDLETKGSYDIRLQTDDGRGGTFEKAFTITIDNVPEADLRITGNNNIPATPLGITTNFDITVHNDGDAAMTISSILYPTAFGGPVSGITIPAASSQVVTMNFTPTIAQLYTGNITIVTNGGTGILSVSADGAIITGTDDGLLSADAINIYPNPASDVVTVDLSEFNGRPLDIQLFDLSGTKAFGVADFREATLKLDIRTYQQGIYLMYFTDGKSTVQKKFMIRK